MQSAQAALAPLYVLAKKVKWCRQMHALLVGCNQLFCCGLFIGACVLRPGICFTFAAEHRIGEDLGRHRAATRRDGGCNDRFIGVYMYQTSICITCFIRDVASSICICV